MTNVSTLGFAGNSTSLFTPEEIDHLMRVEFERGQRYRYDVACMLIQVDRLQQIQMIHGWESREEILRALVDTVKRETRDADLLGYLVQDGLLALFPHTNEAAARALANRMLARSRQLSFQGVAGSIRITLSIGMSHNSGHSNLSFETLKEVAREGLNVADMGGGDRWAETELYSLVERTRAAEEESLRREAEALAPALAESARNPSYRDILESMVAQDGDLERAVALLVDQIMSRAMREAREEAAAEPQPDELPEEREHAYQREIDLLRRRVAKLTESLGMTEQEIARLRRTKSVDDGLASIYRDVQGLDASEAQAEMKKMLMESIFQANLDLQKQVRRAQV